MAKANTTSIQRDPNSYKQVDCAKDMGGMCKALNTWGKEWEIWGNDITIELDELKSDVKRLLQNAGLPPGTGGPPTDATKPPKPPFK